MHRLWSPLLFLLLGFISTPAEEALQERLQQSLTSLSEALETENKGAVVAAIKNKTVQLEAIGHLQENGPSIKGDTLFEIGSITKVFTGIALADAVLTDKAKLDDPVTLFLPRNLVGKESPLHKITLKQLATHTSGLPRLPSNFTLGCNPDDPYAHYDEKALHNYLKNLQPDALSPKGVVAYSNLGMGLLGHLLAEIQETSYPELLDELIFQPLKMNDTFVATPSYRIPRQTQARLAKGHSEGKEVPAWHFESLAGAGAIVSTGEDLLKFAAAHWEPKTPEPLRDAMKLARQPQFPPLGLGWFCDDSIVSHSGATGGFGSFLEIDVSQQSAFLTLQNGFRSLDQRGQEGDFDTIAGLWSGTLAGGDELPVLLNIQADGSAVLYSLNQGCSPIASGLSQFEEEELEIQFPAVNGILKASHKEQGLAGTWTQGQAQPLTLTRTESLPKKLAQALNERFPNDLSPLLGFWSGKIGGGSLFVYLEVQKVGTEHEVFLYSPTQQPAPINISELKFEDEEVSLQVPSINGSFSGDLKKDTLIGHWEQGFPTPLSLRHSQERPETP